VLQNQVFWKYFVTIFAKKKPAEAGSGYWVTRLPTPEIMLLERKSRR
jgi:hypothetical protein